MRYGSGFIWKSWLVNTVVGYGDCREERLGAGERMGLYDWMVGYEKGRGRVWMEPAGGEFFGFFSSFFDTMVRERRGEIFLIFKKKNAKYKYFSFPSLRHSM